MRQCVKIENTLFKRGIFEMKKPYEELQIYKSKVALAAIKGKKTANPDRRG